MGGMPLWRFYKLCADVGIVHLFIPDGGFGAVAVVDDGLIRQGVQLLPDAPGEGVKITAGEIGTANAAAEQHIPAHHKLLLPAIEANMAGGMAGRK